MSETPVASNTPISNQPISADKKEPTEAEMEEYLRSIGLDPAKFKNNSSGATFNPN